MLGAIIGDIVGSDYEFNNTKDYQFPLFSAKSDYTDDSIMTIAVAEWLLQDKEHRPETLASTLRRYGKEYPCPKGGYGSMFLDWLQDPEMQPYNSCGNGSAMRVSAVGWMFDTLDETEHVAEISASVSHNHPEGIKGAQATAAAIFLARTGKSKEEIKQYITERFGYDLSRDYHDVQKTYGWGALCQNTVPEAMIAFLESKDYEDAIRLAVCLGGDSDTLTCITGGIAEAFYQEIPDAISANALKLLPEKFKTLIKRLRTEGRYKKTSATPISFTPQYIRQLKENEIFVFGSNLEGYHTGGAAKIAADMFGAVMGQGVGLQGRSYAIPTMQGGVETIKPYVDEFIAFAKQHPELTFLVTRIGCGIAHFTDKEIAPLFKEAVNVENIRIPKSFYDILIGKDSDEAKNNNSSKPCPQKTNSFKDIIKHVFGKKI